MFYEDGALRRSRTVEPLEDVAAAGVVVGQRIDGGVVGVLVTLLFAVSPEQLGLILALFAGFFLYIGASDLLPESFRSPSGRRSVVATLAGAGLLYLVVRLAQ